MADVRDEVYERLLVLRCQTGDASAFTELVERYQRRLGYFVRKLLAERDGADDVLQEVWLDAWRGLPRLKEPGAFAAWVYRIARDRAYRRLRVRRPPAQPLETVPSRDALPEDAAFTPEDAEQIHAALDRLSADHREVLVLRFVEDMSYDQIADVVGCQVGTIRSRLHYAKTALRRLLERDHP